MARPKKVPDAAPQDDKLALKTSDVLFMRDNFISGLQHLEHGVHELRRAYVNQFNSLLPENHPARLRVDEAFPPAQFQRNVPPGAVPVAPGIAPVAPVAVSDQIIHAPGLIPPPGGVPLADLGVVAAGQTEANVKRKRKPHDPNAPKRALTSYFLFMQHNKPLIKNEHPEWTASQISEESEKRWGRISEQEKQEYDYMYQVDLARYYKQKECYERGEPVPDIGPEEAKRLYQEHLRSGIPFKGRKGKKTDPNQNAHAPGASLPIHDEDDDDDDDEDDDEESDEAPPPPSKANKRQKTAANPTPVSAKQANLRGTPKGTPTAPPAPPANIMAGSMMGVDSSSLMSPDKKRGKAGRKPKNTVPSADSQLAHQLSVAAATPQQILDQETGIPPSSGLTKAGKEKKKAGRKRKSGAGDD